MTGRRTAAVVLGIVLAVTGVSPAFADDALAEHLERVSAAEYVGRGVVMSTWGNDSAAAAYDVSHTGGMSMLSGGRMLVGRGVVATKAETGWSGTSVQASANWMLHERYTLSAPVPVEVMGHAATEYTILQDGLPRIRMVVEQDGVPMLTEVLDGEGAVFRVAALIDFAPGPVEMPVTMDEVQVTGSATAESDLPSSLAGYRRADAYEGPDNTVQAFYTDGLFSFSVFESHRTATPEAFRSATGFEADGGLYRRIVTPTVVWVQWHAPDRSYVLVGDLPPDHMVEVLEGLPDPGDRALFVRLWRRLFG